MVNHVVHVVPNVFQSGKTDVRKVQCDSVQWIHLAQTGTHEFFRSL